MKWFKHDSDAHRDPKLKKLVLKYGLEGYGLYFYCLELIAHEVVTNKLTFELEHDSEIIAHDVRMSRELVEDMMKYMVQLGLFENADGKIVCMKLMHRIDTSQSGNPEFRKQILEAKKAQNQQIVMTQSGRSHDSVSKKSALDIEVDLEVENKSNICELRKRTSPVPVQKIIDLYHEILCPPLPRVAKLTKTREAFIRQRWQEDMPELDHWRNYFNYVATSDFLMGRSQPRDGRVPFRADLEWLCRPANFTKIAEDKYHAVSG